MKKISLFLVAIFAVFTLSACGGSKLTKSGNFTLAYATHYETMNYLVTQSATNSDVFANFIDGLVENDKYGRIVPALATKWDTEVVTEDGQEKQVWTFELRKGVQWVDRNQEEVAEVKADDWVAAAEYILNPEKNSELVGLWFMFIDGAENYNCTLQKEYAEENGKAAPSCTKNPNFKETTFEEVGVKAVDDYTLEYTLKRPAPYFITALTYNLFFPVNREFLQNSGSSFGFDGDNILYNGAYTFKEDEIDAKIVIVKNEKYWDAEHVYIPEVTWIYLPPDAGYDWARTKYENGEISLFRINDKDTAGWKKYVTGDCDSAGVCEGDKLNPVNPQADAYDRISKYTYTMIFNTNRKVWHGETDGGDAGETKTNTYAALRNTNFRKALFHGIDTSIYLSVYQDENPLQWARNIYTPRNLATDQNGKDYADHFIDVYAEENNMSFEDAAAALADGQDNKLDKDLAKTYFDAAFDDLGLTPGTDKIVIESITWFGDADFYAYMQLMSKQLKDDFGDYVELRFLIPSTVAEENAWYDEGNYDIFMGMGWGPDYADPLTYLHTYVVGGEMMQYAGYDTSPEDEETAEEIYGDFTDMVELADGKYLVEEMDQRFRLFAEAEYHMLYEEALIIPFLAPSGKDVRVSNVKPHTAPYAPYGIAQAKFKYMIVLDEPLTRDERNELKAEFEKEKAKLAD